MKIDIMTLFPEMINAVMRESIIGRAQDKGVIDSSTSASQFPLTTNSLSFIEFNVSATFIGLYSWLKSFLGP